MKKLITAQTIKEACTAGIKELPASVQTTIITPEAATLAAKFGICFVEPGSESCPLQQRAQAAGGDQELVKAIAAQVIQRLPADKRDPATIARLVAEQLQQPPAACPPSPSPLPVSQPSITAALAPTAPCCQRVVDDSGLIVVRGGSVRMDIMPEAGPGKQVRLADVITSKDRSPMCAGFMSWRKMDSFAWTLNYDEIDIVLQGTLAITINGKCFEGKVGDLFYIPKGSQIIFGTPTYTKIMYVTYPADWASQKQG
ncbi:MAG TPA: hypothetical protein PKM23_00770 [bacterium]|nr:hypothetical protein [bacterium]